MFNPQQEQVFVKRTKRRSKISLFATLSLFSMNLLAADLYVSPIGNNNNSGTKDAPLLTITKAAQVAKPGTVVHVAPGNYQENVRSSVHGRADARIRFISDKKWGAKIIGSGTESMWLNKANYTDIVGFEVTGSGRLGINNEASFVLIQENYVHDLKVSGGCTGAGGAGINNSNYSASDGDIIGNLVHDIGIPGDCIGVQGIYYSNLRGRILNNIVYRASAFGIHLWHAPTDVLIANNTVFANGSRVRGGGIVAGTGDAPGGVTMEKVRIINNVVYNNPNYSIVHFCYAGENCIGSTNSVSNNLVFGSAVRVSLKNTKEVGTIAADPQFVNYQIGTAGDFHLKSTSPAIDKGLFINAPTNDYDNVLRDSAPDIGAYEFKASIAPNAYFSTNSLIFENTYVESKSASKFVTITNYGSAPLILKDFKASGDFSIDRSSTCVLGKSYAPAANCNINLIFAPLASGGRTGSLTIESNNSPALKTIPLSGSGIADSKAPKISLSISSLNFGSVDVGSSSIVKLVTLTNSGNAPLILPSAFVLSKDFAFGGTGTCKPNFSYAPGQDCAISVLFKPSSAGSISGKLDIPSNASVYPVSVSLSGAGVALKPAVTISVKALSFGQVKVKSRSGVKIVTITNTGKGLLVFGQAFQMSGKFSFGGSGTCAVGVSYGPGKSCTASVVFLPMAKGFQSGVLSIISNASTARVSLEGTGI
jgi:hypothetical protein